MPYAADPIQLCRTVRSTNSGYFLPWWHQIEIRSLMLPPHFDLIKISMLVMRNVVVVNPSKIDWNTWNRSIYWLHINLPPHAWRLSETMAQWYRGRERKRNIWSFVEKLYIPCSSQHKTSQQSNNFFSFLNENRLFIDVVIFVHICLIVLFWM